MRKLSALPLALLACLLLSGCASTLRALWPGGTTAADAEWRGVKSGEVVPILASLDPRVSQADGLLQLIGLPSVANRFGVLLPLTVAGETTPRYVLCTDDWAARCSAIPINTPVSFAGHMEGLLWKPTRLGT